MENDRTLISIVIIAYNIENYILKCIDSVVQQSYKEIEIIIVNDGSTDSTGEKILGYQQKDKRVRVINKNNEGITAARESGYKIASGKYILFIDGDDWLDYTAIEKLYAKAIESQSDIVCYKLLYKSDDGTERKSRMKGEQISFNRLEGYEFLNKLLLNRVIPSICIKFIKKDFIEKNNLHFPVNITYAEDLVFSCMLAMHQPRVTMLNEYLYYYFKRESSITKSISDKILDVNKAILLIKEELIKKDLFEKLDKEYEYLSFIHNFYYRMEIITNTDNIYNKTLYDMYKQYKINIHRNKYIKKRIAQDSFGYRSVIKLYDLDYTLGTIYLRLRRMVKK